MGFADVSLPCASSAWLDEETEGKMEQVTPQSFVPAVTGGGVLWHQLEPGVVCEASKAGAPRTEAYGRNTERKVKKVGEEL